MGTFATHIYELAKMVGAVREEGVFSGVTNTTGTDAVGLAGYADDDLNGTILYVYSGTGLGQERRVTDHVGATGVLTVPTWGTNPTDASYIILNAHWRVSDLRLALLMAIREQKRNFLLPKVDTSLTVALPTMAYTVPAGFAAIKDIWVERNQGQADFLDPIPPDCWYLNRGATKQIVFEREANDRFNFLKDGHSLRVLGQQYQEEPDADSDTIDIPMGTLLFLAGSMALNMARGRDVANARGHGQQASILYQQWLNLRGDDWIPVTPESRWVDHA